MSISRPLSINLLRRLSHPLRPSRSIIQRSISQSRNRTSQDLRQRIVSSHLLAGALGGCIVIVGGYTWYHFSPLRSIVEAVKRSRIDVEETKTKVKHLLDYAREQALLLAKRLGSEAKRVRSEVLSQSSVLRTIKEKAAWLRRSIRRDDSTPRTPQANEDSEKKK